MKKIIFISFLFLSLTGVAQKIEIDDSIEPLVSYVAYISDSGTEMRLSGSDKPELLTATQIPNGAKVTLPTGEIEIQFRQNKVFSYGINQVACITVVTSASGVQVGSGEAITVENYAYPTDSRIIISFVNGISNIRLKGTSGDIVAITY